MLQERGRAAVNDRPHGTGKLVPMQPHSTPLQRFFAKVDITDGCWNWTAGTRRGGYGQFFIRKRADRSHVVATAHRFCYEALLGEIPDGLEPDHLCRNPACVRPDHLELVTHRENSIRGTSFASRANNTHCIHGHEFDEKNTLIRKNGTRACRRCHADREAKRARV